MKLARLISIVVVAAALVGCGGASEGISGGGRVTSGTVTVYSLLTDPAGRNRDFVDGEKLALSDAGGRIGSLAVNFNSLDLGTDESDEAETVRRAITDPQIIAAIVDASPVTVPLFNAAGVLQVAPGGDFALANDPNAQPLGRQTMFEARGELPASFAADFREAFGRDASPQAEDGYRAMSGVLQAIERAGAAGTDRTRVIESY